MNIPDNRSLSRELAFKFLFNLESTNPEYITKNWQEESSIMESLNDNLNNFYNSFVESDAEHPNNHLTNEIKVLAEIMIVGVIKNNSLIETSLKKSIKKWKIEKLNKTDLIILKLACFEIKYYSETPIKVALNEAIKLAKNFGEQNSPSFINGILDNVAKEI